MKGFDNMKKLYTVDCTYNKNLGHYTISFKTLKEALSFVSNQCHYISNYSMNDETLNNLNTFLNDVQTSVPFCCAVFHLDDYDYHYQISAIKSKNHLIEKLHALFKKI